MDKKRRAEAVLVALMLMWLALSIIAQVSAQVGEAEPAGPAFRNLGACLRILDADPAPFLARYAAAHKQDEIDALEVLIIGTPTDADRQRLVAEIAERVELLVLPADDPLRAAVAVKEAETKPVEEPVEPIEEPVEPVDIK